MKLSILAFAVLLFSQQQQQQVPRGRIEGTVLREGTTEPVSGAKITVIRVNAAGTPVPTAGTINTYLINPSPNVPVASGAESQCSAATCRTTATAGSTGADSNRDDG
jgi:hypothetical protein